MRVALELRRNRRHHVEQLVALGAFGDTSPSGEMLVPDFEHDDRIGDDVVESLRVHGRATHRPNDDVSITGLHMHDRRHVAFSRLPSGAREKKLLQRALAERGNTPLFCRNSSIVLAFVSFAHLANAARSNVAVSPE